MWHVSIIDPEGRFIKCAAHDDWHFIVIIAIARTQCDQFIIVPV